MKPRGFSISEATFGHQFVRGQTHGDAERQLILDPLLNSTRCTLDRSEEPLGAREIYVRLIQADLFHQGEYSPRMAMSLREYSRYRW